MAEEVKKQEHPVMVCPKCGKKVINKGLRISVDMECKEDFKSVPEDFLLAVKGIQAALLCKTCKVVLVQDNPQSKIIVPDKKIILARK